MPVLAAAAVAAAVIWVYLLAAHGENYARYRESVPMLLPSTAGHKAHAPKYGLSKIA